MMNQFISLGNKAFLWNILNENKMFDQYSNTDFETIKTIFEEKINDIRRIHTPGNKETILELNRDFLTQFKYSLLHLNSRTSVNSLSESSIATVSGETTPITNSNTVTNEREFENYVPDDGKIDKVNEAITEFENKQTIMYNQIQRLTARIAKVEAEQITTSEINIKHQGLSSSLRWI